MKLSRVIRGGLMLSAALLTGILAFSGCGKKAEQASAVTTPESIAPTAAPAMSAAERGKYLVTVAGCNDCHTPWKMGEHGPEPDMTRMLSGHPENMPLPPAPKAVGPWMVSAAATMTAWAGPWGVSYTANLTPDSTGLGKWDETTFMLALRNGKHIGNGRPILPPMPWQGFSKMTDDDLKAIFAFLKTIPPIRNKVPEPIMVPPPTAMK